MTKSIADIASDVATFHRQAVDNELAEILLAGVSRDRIAIECHPGPRTVITVDGIPRSAFTVGYLDTSELLQPKLGDRIVLNQTSGH